ncbi:RICIN domain-containing protein [Kitasatospora sp. GP82]|uniref:RICIN domain-containing protein n=1 Tax=Kitasatospora sp. GP82 TaxID=3035089 RepID=UPI002475F3F2|nr:RICIN domain-containing protein [Kitasatospora sp. GP82]
MALIAAAVVSVQLVALTAPATTGPGGTAIAMSDAPTPETDFTLPAAMASFAASPPPVAPSAPASPSAATPSSVPSTQPADSTPISQPAPTATYTHSVPAVLVDPGSGHCLNVNTADNSVGIWSCDGRPSQQWIATATAELRTQGTGLCLAPASDAHPGTRVMVRSCTGSESQKWTAQSDGSLINTPSGLCLDVLNGYRNNGAPLQLWTCG